ncbi:hypothetical protein GCM10023185_24230 [Hymenobacter saemangeumensis]|uniref:Uncharacterized protein n=1 Tax=Hymenobacter saemangeumensis TaxID=1084522 RepID=A0ABP8IGM3_9BACT
MQAPTPEPAATEPPSPLPGSTFAHGPAGVAAPRPVELPPLEILPTISSPDKRVTLTNDRLTVKGQTFLLLELERVELTPVQWLLWYLLGGLGLAAVMIAFLSNWLRTGPAMLGMALTALMLAFGRRGTNRLRLHRLGQQMVNFALPGDSAAWQQLSGEVNRRIHRLHDRAAAEAALLLAAADEARRQEALAAQLREQASQPGSEPT